MPQVDWHTLCVNLILFSLVLLGMVYARLGFVMDLCCRIWEVLVINQLQPIFVLVFPWVIRTVGV